MTDEEITVPNNNLDKMSVENINTDISEPDKSENKSEIINENVIISSKTDEKEEDNDNLNRVDSQVQKKRLTLIDSDSEDEMPPINISALVNDEQNSVEQKNDSDNESVGQIKTKVNKKRLTLIDSDSEDEENVPPSREDKKENKDLETEQTASNDEVISKQVNKSSKKRLTIVDSDSEDGENINSILRVNEHQSDKENTEEGDEDGKQDDSNSNQTQKKRSRLLQIMYDSDSEEEIQTTSASMNKPVTMSFQTDIDIVDTEQQTFRRLKNLCDSESSGEEPEAPEDTTEHISKENIIKQKRRTKKSEPVQKKMTGKEALEQRRQIKSESQKMVRETRVHLPYHRPKQRTLQEFLKHRSLINTAIKAPPNTPTSLSIKMVNKNIKFTEQKLIQREKQIEEFYKSESEAEDEPESEPEQKEETMNKTAKDAEEKCEKLSEETGEKKGVEEAEKIEEMEVDNNETQKNIAESVQHEETHKIFEETQNNSEETQNSKTQNNSEEAQNNSEEIWNNSEETRNNSEETLNNSEETRNNSEETRNIPEEAQNSSKAHINSKETQNFSEEKENNSDETENSSEKSQNNLTEEIEEISKRNNLEEILKEADELMDVDNEEENSLNNETTLKNNLQAQTLAKKNTENLEAEPVQEDSIETEKNKGIEEDLDENTEEDNAAKLKELREILEKNLPSSKPDLMDVEIVTEKLILETNQSTLEIDQTELEIEIRPSQLPEDKEEKRKRLLEMEEKLNKLNPIVALRSNFQPRLSGGPNELIVLDDDIEKSKRINNLMQRFMKHTEKKTIHKKAEVSILSVEGGTISKETIILADEEIEEEECAKKMQIPGIKMKKLRIELEDQILKQRLDEWKKKQEELKLDNEDETYAGEKENCGLDNKILDNEEEEELTDTSSEESEEEEEEDIEIKETTRVKSAFVDEEAEDSDENPEENDENEENDEEIGGDNEENEDDEEDDVEDEQEDSDKEDSDKEETNLEAATKKPLRRIIKPTEDSDEDTTSRPPSSCDQNKTTEKSVEMLNSQTSQKNTNWDDIDEEITAYQPQSEALETTPCKIATQSKNDLTTFLTPTLHLTALQGMNSASKSLQNSPNVNTFLPEDPSPLKAHSLIKTKLFPDQETIDDDLESLCSGKFPTQLRKFPTQLNNKNEKTNSNFSTQENDLLNICSGIFSGITQNKSSATITDSLPVKSTQSLDLLMNEDSQNFKLTIENEATSNSPNNEELQPMKLSFEENNSNQENIKPQETKSSSKFLKMIIASSSEDEDKENHLPKKKKLKKKRKYIVDDISITDEEFEERMDEFEEEEEEVETAKNVDYDSEENEIELVDFEEMEETEKPANKASDFFENEAELSESEWGSEDEDEKNLDDYEIDEADSEKINEQKVQRELERMHMRNVLDKDQREVKLLQEMLLEDGELHGVGRERKFRWKNADSLAWGPEGEKPKEEEEECEEIESEFQWRTMRHEREMFLKEQKKPADEEEMMNDSQLMQLGQKALSKSFSDSQNSSQKKTPIAESISKSSDIKLPFALASKRGSFLQRSETTLARLAEITKVNSILGRAQNSKNFVFTAVEKTQTTEEEINIKKRKAEQGTPKVMKKLRIADLSPAVQKRKTKLNMS